MKTIFKTLGLGGLVAAFMAVGGMTAFGQDPCADLDAINALDAKIRGDYPKMETKKQAIDEGKQYLEKYGNCPVTADFSGWLKGRIPVWEADINKAAVIDDKNKLHAKFDNGLKTKAYDDSFAATDQFSSKYADDATNIQQFVALGMIGPFETAATPKNTKYNANSEKYAKLAIDQLKSGNTKALANGHYGVFQFDCASKDDCISVLTFGLAYMTNVGDNNKQAALPYYYQVTQIPGTYKTSPNPYAIIGDYYYENFVQKLDAEVKALIAAQKPEDTPEVRDKQIADIKAKVAMENGYLERAMDAYSRGYTYAKADPSSKAQADSLYKKVSALYGVRFQKTDGVDTWITTAVAKPFPDPASPVAPIQDDTAVTTTTTGGPGSGMGAANGTGVGAAKGTGTGAANGNGVGAAKGTGTGAANGSGTGNTSAAKPTTTPKPIKP
jgi:hypothetical protein